MGCVTFILSSPNLVYTESALSHESSSGAVARVTGNTISYRLSQRTNKIEKNQMHSYMAVNSRVARECDRYMVASGLG